ncbi:DNA excision repair protein ERCC-8 [Anabrus simplex]|uniref:DNA excision repair protein ERCC-8 n=1 Tax=Anabrus simplex TaxID=316456 RepID=UPI0035A352C9
MLRFLEDFRTGIVEPKTLITAETSKRSYNLELSKHRDVENVFTAGVNSLDIDRSERRYLLSGSADGTIHIHDLHNFSGLPHFTSKLICKVDRNNRNAHRYSVECVQWYPLDNGLFITSGMDKVIKIWDTNCMKPADFIALEGRIFQHHIALSPNKSVLVAVASSLNQVLLIDLRSGSYTHELRGHTSSTLCCQWSPTEDFLLATGSCDNKVFLWDIRSPKTILKSFSLYDTKDHVRNDFKTATAHDGCVNGLGFTSDGFFLLSYGTDNRMQLWNVYGGYNEMVNYGEIPNETKKCMQFDVTSHSSPSLVYVPSEGNIFVFEIHSGKKVSTLLGHYNTVNSCIYHPFYHELYSAGNDRNVLVWTADHNQDAAYDDYLKSHTHYKVTEEKRSRYFAKNITADAWSSDEGDES